MLINSVPLHPSILHSGTISESQHCTVHGYQWLTLLCRAGWLLARGSGVLLLCCTALAVPPPPSGSIPLCCAGFLQALAALTLCGALQVLGCCGSVL